MGSSVVESLVAVLNIVLVAGGTAVQLPQIYKIVSTKSVKGLSETSWIVQTYSTAFYCAYNYILSLPFMTWGDAFFAVLEYAVIVGLIWMYGVRRDQLSELHGNIRKVVIFLMLTLVLITVTRKSPLWLTTLLGVLPMPMVVAGRVPQILANHKNQSAGQLSLASMVMQCAGNLARIISTIILVPDLIVLLSHATAFTCNTIPLVQMVYYDILRKDLRNAKPQIMLMVKNAQSLTARLLKGLAVAKDESETRDLPANGPETKKASSFFEEYKLSGSRFEPDSLKSLPKVLSAEKTPLPAGSTSSADTTVADPAIKNRRVSRS